MNSDSYLALVGPETAVVLRVQSVLELCQGGMNYLMALQCTYSAEIQSQQKQVLGETSRVYQP